MEQYIFGERNRIHIINLEKTQPLFAEAIAFAKNIVGDGGTVLFVGTKRSARDAVQKEATRCEMPYVNQRWLGGMLTNFKTIRASIKRLQDLTEMQANGTLNRRGKKEATMLKREMDKLERSLGGIKNMASLPDAVFLIDVGHEKIAILEAAKLGIPVVAVVDTNCTPEGIDYVIPGNDDAMRAVQLYTSGIADAVLDGRASGPTLAVSEDDFVELDENGNPQPKSGRPAKPRNAPSRGAGANRKPPPPARRRPVVAAVAPEAAVDAVADVDDLDVVVPGLPAAGDAAPASASAPRRRPGPGAGRR
jgi:small subunit ribosomal protein S2